MVMFNMSMLPAGGPVLKDPNLKVEKIFQDDPGITTSMAFLGPNDILILEKNEGKVHRIREGILLPEPVLTVSNIGTWYYLNFIRYTR